MEDSEQWVALKVAYADVILNTAKEAAARVMVSEKRAASFQHELNCSKEESLRLLLRLKQIIDAKTTEAEITSSNQKRKIDELEAQLHEAEDIIIELRMELSCMQQELEKAKNIPVRGLITSEDASSLKDPTHEPNVQSPLCSGHVTVVDSDSGNNILNQVYTYTRCGNEASQSDQSNVSHVESYYPANPDVATILMTSKKPELSRNGCTQRICALERNSLDGKFTPGGLDGQYSLLKKEFIMKSTAGDEREGMQSFIKTKNNKTMGFSRGERKNSVKVRTLRRRRKTLFHRIKAASSRFHTGLHTKPCQSSSILSCCRTYKIDGNCKPYEGSCTVSSIKVENTDRTKESRDLEELQYESSYCEDDIVATYNGKRNGKVRGSNDIASSFQSTPEQLIEPCQSSTVVNFSKTLSSVCYNLKSNEDQLNTAETETKIKPLARLDPGLTLIKCNSDPLSTSNNVTVSVRALDKSRFVQRAADNDIKLGDESVLVGQVGNSGEISTLPPSELSANIVNVSFTHSHLKDGKASNVANESSIKVDNIKSRLLKYTFQRKRKKESLSDLDEKTSVESSLKRRAVEKENSLHETPKSNLLNESSIGNQLGQVAHQLISLPGKSWR